MALEKNVVYHRAGVDLRPYKGYQLLMNDITELAETIVSEDSIEIKSFKLESIIKNNNDNMLNFKSDVDWGVCIIEKWNDIDAQDRENIDLSEFNLSNNGDLQGSHIVDCCKITLDKDKKYYFLISYIATTYDSNSSKLMNHILVRYDFIMNQTSSFLYDNCPSTYGNLGRMRWNVVISSKNKAGGMISHLAGTASYRTNYMFTTSDSQLPFQITAQNAYSQESSVSILGSSSLGLVFTTLQDISDKNKTYPAIFMVNQKEPDEFQGYSNYAFSAFVARCFSPCLENIEIFPASYFYNCIQDQKGAIPVLVNMTSKIADYYAPYLYLKETPHENLFGVVQLGDKKFIAGSFYCLDCGKVGET